MNNKIIKQKKVIEQEMAKLDVLEQEQRDREYQEYLERKAAFEKAYPKADYFEIDGRIYISYSIWRRHLAPIRAKLPHKSYYPTLAEFAEYQALASDDGYAYYAYNNMEYEIDQQWIHLLNDLRRQAGLRFLSYQEEAESLDKGYMICYN